MENTKGNFKGHGAHRRFFKWAKNKMTGADAFDIMFGEKGEEYPAEMKEEFTALFDRMKQMHTEAHESRKAFMTKWKEYMPERPDCSQGAYYGGQPLAPGMEACGPHGEGFPGHKHRHHDHGHGGFGW